ncbi:Chemotaxis response regulator protein-glutamate methylesterase [Neomoorella glycerini]|uniref:Protein-glutamate methylesterase/protein-glutamine glutaminase n=1 Tax=Neomoorella glycerini TaxID=55779 RepID=A0A6I5ZMN0_9FIRM|nr:chemotaxis-specific protein-glutamate methyltransferase CheB [Moorella glycerini]QGP90881.1 Chemotaxis response regulator protein-glutamate methylesterase [Moorella glycerini]
MKRIKVLIVDDSAFMRRVLRQILETAGDIEVLDVARDGLEGVEKALLLQPDVVTLDINMPGMDGLTALHYIVTGTQARVVMISSLTQEDALATFEALELGAVDFVAKPDGTVSLGINRLAGEIVSKVRAAARARVRRGARRWTAPARKKPHGFHSVNKMDWLVVIGVSTGGPRTLEDILPQLPAGLQAGVVVVQHMPARFTASLASRFNQHCPFRVEEAGEGLPVEPGMAVIARGGYHLLFLNMNEKLCCHLSSSPENTAFKPSVNVTLQAAMECFVPDRIIGVLLTGMGDDGADAMLELRRRGGFTIAESEETAVVWGMPRAAIERGGASVVAPSYKIADIIKQKVGG